MFETSLLDFRVFPVVLLLYRILPNPVNMKKIYVTISILVSSLVFYCSFAQTNTKISKPQLLIENNKLIISYDIMDSEKVELFNIWIEVTDSTGKIVEAHSLSGDIGENIKGGKNKQIFWDLEEDSISLEIGIYVEINAEVVSSPEQTTVKTQPSAIKRSSIILQSAAIPGLGLTRVKKNKLHIIKGALGYGCIATSIIYNKKAVDSYEKYLKSSDQKESKELLNTSKKQDNVSEALVYVAVGVWVTDIIWTIVGTSKAKKDEYVTSRRGLSLSAGYEIYTSSPLLTLTYNF